MSLYDFHTTYCAEAISNLLQREAKSQHNNLVRSILLGATLLHFLPLTMLEIWH